MGGFGWDEDWDSVSEDGTGGIDRSDDTRDTQAAAEGQLNIGLMYVCTCGIGWYPPTPHNLVERPCPTIAQQGCLRWMESINPRWRRQQ